MTNYLLEFLPRRFTAFYIVCNAHIVGYCGGVIAYRLIFWVLSHRMLHQISTKLTPRLKPNQLDKLEFVHTTINNNPKTIKAHIIKDSNFPAFANKSFLFLSAIKKQGWQIARNRRLCNVFRLYLRHLTKSGCLM